MDPNLIYAKTPTGDEAVRQSTRVVQRNLRMVLVLVDGKLTVQDLTAKIGDARLVERALHDLEEGGFIAPSFEAASIWKDSKLQAVKERVSALSQFSTFGPKTPNPAKTAAPGGGGDNFPSFDKALISSSSKAGVEAFAVEPERAPGMGDLDRDARISASKLIVGGLLGVVLLLLGVGFFYPYDNLKPAIERAASQYLQTTVKIDRVGLGFSPLPYLELADVRVGEVGDSRIESVRIASPHLLLGSGRHRLDRVDVSGATIEANQVVAIFSMAGLPSASAPSPLVIRRIRIEQGRVGIRDLVLRDISGEILFRADGSVEKSSFQAVERSIRLEALPSPQGVMLTIDGQGWKLAGLPIAFDSFQAKGLLQKDKLLIQSLNTTFLGGILQGTWLLDWRSGLAMAGDATLKHLDCRKVSAAFAPSLKLEGGLGGTLRLRGAGNDWEGLWRNVEATLDAEVSRGILHGVDLGEVARRGAGSVVRSGSTKFDRLSAKISINSSQTHGREVRLDAGMMTAAGQFVVGRDRFVDGSITVGIQTSVSSLRVPARISGVLPDLVVSGSR